MTKIIQKTSQLWDYSTSIDEENFEGFPCSCGITNCRKIAGSFRDLPANVQGCLYPYLLPYLKTKYLNFINNQRLAMF